MKTDWRANDFKQGRDGARACPSEGGKAGLQWIWLGVRPGKIKNSISKGPCQTLRVLKNP